MKVKINPIFDDKALIRIDQGRIEDLIEAPGKWFNYRKFHLLFEKWNPLLHGRPSVLRSFGGWIAIKNLTLEYCSRETLEAIGQHFGGLEEISIDTLNLLDVSEAKIKVRKNVCGFIPATININNEFRGSIHLLFGDIIPMNDSSSIIKEFFGSEFKNPIDQDCLNKVKEDEVSVFSP